MCTVTSISCTCIHGIALAMLAMQARHNLPGRYLAAHGVLKTTQLDTDTQPPLLHLDPRSINV